MQARTLKLALASVCAAAIVAAGVTAYAQIAGSNMVASAVKPADRADDFRLVDQNSRAHLLSYYKFAPAIVIVSHAVASSDMNDAALSIRNLSTSLKGTDAQLFLMNSTPGVTREAISADMKALNLDLPVLIDDTQLVGESLGVSHAAQAMVINPKTWKVVYSGPTGAKLNAAIDALKAGKPVTASHIDMTTAKLPFPNRDKAAHAKISYEKEVAPILAKNCVACHSEGAIAKGPMAPSRWTAMRRSSSGRA